jgi:phage gpG-like protein
VSRVRVVIPEANVRRVLLGSTGLLTVAISESGRQVANQAKRYAPVDTGRLRADIQSTITVRGSEVRAKVGTGVEYAAAVHEGSTRRRGGRTVTTRGRPFLTRAVRDVVGVAVRK